MPICAQSHKCKIVGMLGGNFVQAEVRLEVDDQGRHRVGYRLRERTPESEQVRIIHQGYFNYPWDDIREWEFNQEVSIGVARFGSEILYFFDGSDVLAKHHWFEGENQAILEPFDGRFSIVAGAFAETRDTEIAGSVVRVTKVNQ